MNESACPRRDLRFLRHPAIVAYVDDFLHAPPSASGSFSFSLWQKYVTRHGGAAAAAALPEAAASSGVFFVCIVMEWCPMDLHRYILVSYPVPIQLRGYADFRVPISPMPCLLSRW